MVSSNVQRVFHEVKSLVQSLEPDERRQLRAMMDREMGGAAPETPEEALTRKLVESGIGRPRTPGPRVPNPVPIQVIGKPLSETLIEERR